ncbi:MAG: hypothetical protein SGI99_12615 [Pseudomonadota bacterium]|nr:hypothetical protein [Pseudomonadota bacterium]
MPNDLKRLGDIKIEAQLICAAGDLGKLVDTRAQQDRIFYDSCIRCDHRLAQRTIGGGAAIGDRVIETGDVKCHRVGGQRALKQCNTNRGSDQLWAQMHGEVLLSYVSRQAEKRSQHCGRIGLDALTYKYAERRQKRTLLRRADALGQSVGSVRSPNHSNPSANTMATV